MQNDIKHVETHEYIGQDSWTLWTEPQLSLFVFCSLSSLLLVRRPLTVFPCSDNRTLHWLKVATHPHFTHMSHVSSVVSVVPDLFDFSIHFLSFIISLITLLFLLPDIFNFHDMVDKYPCVLLLRTLAPWPRTCLSQVMSPTTTSSHRLMSNTPENEPPTGYEPNDHFITEAYVEYTQEVLEQAAVP